MSNGTDEPSADAEDGAVRRAAIAIIERGDAAASPLHGTSQESAEKQAEDLRRLAVELGRSVDA